MARDERPESTRCDGGPHGVVRREILGRSGGVPLEHLRGDAQRRFQRAAYGDEQGVVRGVDHGEVKGEVGLRSRLDGEVAVETRP